MKRWLIGDNVFNFILSIEIVPLYGELPFEKYVFINAPQNTKAQVNKHVYVIINEQCVSLYFR